MSHTKLMRPDIKQAYTHVMASYISRVKHIPYDQAKQKVAEIVKQKFQDKQLAVIRASGHGQTKGDTPELSKFLDDIKDKVVAPNGGVYYTTTQLPSPVSEFLNDKKKERSAVKKKQLKSLAAGEYAEANRYWYVQASIKILMNSLPGAYASAYSIFYDKCAYNTITSTGRAMVRRSSTTTEQFLGGEFAWWSEDELLNYIMVNLFYAPDEEQINFVLNKYRMHAVTADMLYAHYKTYFSKYTKETDYLKVKELIETLAPYQLAFLYYYCNLRNIMMTNEQSFKQLIHHLLDVSSYPKIEGTAADVKSVPDTIKILVAVAFSDTLQGYTVDKICTEHTELIPTLLGICKGIQTRLDDMEDLFNTFVNTNCDIPNIRQRGQFSKRNTVVLQDTDSSMFTTKTWADWYHGSEKFYVDQESLAINALCVYWLSNAVAHVMYRFSCKLGVTDPYMHTLNFKNEFLYPVFLLTATKKVYASVIKVQEGSVLNPPKIEIKGQTLRGSSKSKEVNAFIEDLLVKKILEPATLGKISAYDLIETMIRFENSMRTSLSSGEMTFLNTESLKMDNDYKNPDQPILIGYRFWEDLMASKYGDISRPAKVVTFPAIRPTPGYLADLQKNYPEFYPKLKHWVETHPKYVSRIVVNPALGYVPPEITGLIDVEHLINLNITPAYNILNQVGVNCGGHLFSSIYDVVDVTGKAETN